MFTAQPEEGISSSRSQNGYYVFVALVLTCYNGTSKIHVLEDMLDFVFRFDLSLKHYFVLCYVLLIFCVLLASFLLHPLLSHASTAFSCWVVECHAGLCSRLMMKSLLFQVTSIGNKMFVPGVNCCPLLYTKLCTSCHMLTLCLRGKKNRLFFWFQWGDNGKSRTSKDCLM